MRSILAGSLAFLFMAAASDRAEAQQGNFQISAAPIAYPFFEPRRKDIKVTGTYLAMESKDGDISIAGGGASGVFRYAFSELFAMDASFGLTALTGEMPGFAMPFYYGGGYWNPVVTGKSDLYGLSVPMSFNLEVQALHSRAGSLIFFGGPTLTANSLTMETPYYAVSGVTTAARTLFTTTTKVIMGGAQFGVQGGINAGNFKFTPFFMMTSQSGTAMMTFESGYKGTSSFVGDTTSDIDPFTTSSMGMDIIYAPWNLSFGTVFQQIAAKKSADEMSTTLFQLSWHFRK